MKLLWALGGALIAGFATAPFAEAVPVTSADRVVASVPVRVVTIDLRDPDTVLDVVLANAPPRTGPPRGQATFPAFVRKARAASLINGTFFSMDAEKRLMGTMVQSGRLINHVSFRPHGTTFGLRPGNLPELVPAGNADWRRYWMTLTAGPRLLTDGRPVLRPGAEGFTDPAVVRPATRSALGFSRDGRTLLLVSIHAAVGLEREAAIMKALGCHQALNLDGGTTRALADRDRIRVMPGRPLTNAIAVYDTRSPAPPALKTAFQAFTYNREGPPPLTIAGRTRDPGPFACGRRTPWIVVGTSRPYSFEDWLFTRVAGRPAVQNYDGWLELNGAGSLVAPWPARQVPRPGQSVSVLARRIGPWMGLHLGRTGHWLEVREDGWVLRQGTRVLARRAGKTDGDRHLYTFTLGPREVSVYLDGQFRFKAPMSTMPGGIGFSGHIAYKGLDVSR